MTKTLAKPQAKTLVSLASKIQAEHEACERDAQSAVEHAIKAGELLQVAKSKVKHGGWLSWLEENFPATEQTAQRYMRLSANASRVTDFDSVRGALAELAGPKLDAPGVSRDGSDQNTSGRTRRVSGVRGHQEPTAEESELVEAEVVEELPTEGIVLDLRDGGLLNAVKQFESLMKSVVLLSKEKVNAATRTEVVGVLDWIAVEAMNVSEVLREEEV